jgi:hypothetical protein
MRKGEYRPLYCNKNNPLYLIALMIIFTATHLWAYTQKECINCHKPASQGSSRHINIETFGTSVHGNVISCLDCHTGVKNEGHKSTRGLGAVDCRNCHDQENRHGLHAQSRKPRCQSCHTRHNILGKSNKKSSLHPDNLKQTCGTCHAMRTADSDFFSGLPAAKIKSHPKQDFSRDFSDTNCIGCHQGKAAHGEISPVDDQGCHRCHITPEGNSLLYGHIHPRANKEMKPANLASAMIYRFCLAILVWGGFKSFLNKLSAKKK